MAHPAKWAGCLSIALPRADDSSIGWQAFLTRHIMDGSQDMKKPGEKEHDYWQKDKEMKAGLSH